MKKQFSITNFDLKKIEFEMEVQTTPNGLAHHVSVKGVGWEYSRDCVCHNYDLYESVVSMEENAKAQCQKFDTKKCWRIADSMMGRCLVMSFPKNKGIFTLRSMFLNMNCHKGYSVALKD